MVQVVLVILGEKGEYQLDKQICSLIESVSISSEIRLNSYLYPSHIADYKTKTLGWLNDLPNLDTSLRHEKTVFLCADIFPPINTKFGLTSALTFSYQQDGECVLGMFDGYSNQEWFKGFEIVSKFFKNEEYIHSPLIVIDLSLSINFEMLMKLVLVQCSIINHPPRILCIATSGFPFQNFKIVFDSIIKYNYQQ